MSADRLSEINRDIQEETRAQNTVQGIMTSVELALNNRSPWAEVKGINPFEDKSNIVIPSDRPFREKIATFIDFLRPGPNSIDVRMDFIIGAVGGGILGSFTSAMMFFLAGEEDITLGIALSMAGVTAFCSFLGGYAQAENYRDHYL